MSDETLRTLITCGTTILVTLISNILVFAMSKLNNKNQNDQTILEKQYKEIFAPIHKMLYYETSDKNNIPYDKIDKTLSNNYYLIPKSILDSFSNINDIETNIDGFKNYISTCFRYLSSILGYSKENLSGHDRREAKKILSSKSFDYTYTKTVTIFIILSVVLSSIYNILFTDFADIIKFVVSIIGYSFIVFIWLMIIYLLTIIIPGIFPTIVKKSKGIISKIKNKRKEKEQKDK